MTMAFPLLPFADSDAFVKRIDAHLKKAHEDQVADVERRLDRVEQEQASKPPADRDALDKEANQAK